MSGGTGLRVHVLGEPVGRQLVAEAAVLGFLDHRGADRRELVAEPDIVQETGDLAVRLSPLRAPDDQVREGG